MYMPLPSSAAAQIGCTNPKTSPAKVTIQYIRQLRVFRGGCTPVFDQGFNISGRWQYSLGVTEEDDLLAAQYPSNFVHENLGN
jgi:hypothetical protein